MNLPVPVNTSGSITNCVTVPSFLKGNIRNGRLTRAPSLPTDTRKRASSKRPVCTRHGSRMTSGWLGHAATVQSFVPTSISEKGVFINCPHFCLGRVFERCEKIHQILSSHRIWVRQCDSGSGTNSLSWAKKKVNVFCNCDGTAITYLTSARGLETCAEKSMTQTKTAT